MKSTLLLNSNENTRQVEEEEKSKFVKSILEIMGVPIDEAWVHEQLTIDGKIKLLSILNTYNIKIIDYSDGRMQIYVDNEIVGEWNKCHYILKRDLSELDPNKKLYLEMHCDWWSVFDGDVEEE